MWDWDFGKYIYICLGLAMGYWGQYFGEWVGEDSVEVDEAIQGIYGTDGA